MSRTTANLVRSLLGKDYGALPNGTLPDLQQYIDSVVPIIDRVAADAVRRKGILLTGLQIAVGTSPGSDTPGTELELIERWLAAHTYALMDKPYSSKSVGGASASFQGQTGMGFEITFYGQQACRIDYSGCLRNLDKQQQARGVWLGRRCQDIPRSGTGPTTLP